MTRLRLFATAALVALSPFAVQSQSSPLIGDWSVEVTAGMRIEDGEPTAIRAKAKLSIVEAGDSLVATLTMEPNPEIGTRPPARFATAKVMGNAATFVQRGQARMNLNGEESTVTSISTWSLKAEGDAISGTVARAIEGMEMPAMPAQPVSGTRIK